jgi:hypothetical protein
VSESIKHLHFQAASSSTSPEIPHILWNPIFHNRVKKSNSNRDEIYENNSRIHLNRSQNKYTNYKGIKNDTNFGQITGIQEKLDTTCK